MSCPWPIGCTQTLDTQPMVVPQGLARAVVYNPLPCSSSASPRPHEFLLYMLTVLFLSFTELISLTYIFVEEMYVWYLLDFLHKILHTCVYISVPPDPACTDRDISHGIDLSFAGIKIKKGWDSCAWLSPRGTCPAAALGPEWTRALLSPAGRKEWLLLVNWQRPPPTCNFQLPTCLFLPFLLNIQSLSCVSRDILLSRLCASRSWVKEVGC